MLFRIMIIAASATLALTGAGAAGAAIAASPVSPGGTIDGCYTNAAVNGTHAVVLENQGITCPSGTTAVNWNEQGPAGPAGTGGSTRASRASRNGQRGLWHHHNQRDLRHRPGTLPERLQLADQRLRVHPVIGEWS
jgi:hypothetical protein